jgi:NAD(P)-dependent dehydrogenase (short-subunit alcohol dehydrogenase family)
MAREFASRGRNLALCARRGDRLHELQAELRASAPEARVLVRTLDVNDSAAVFRTFRELAAELGSLDRVIVNAGVGKGAKPLGTGHFEANRQILETNLVAALAQCEAALEIFREQGAGHLVTIASMSALRGLPGHMTAYAASKAGLWSLTQGIQADLLRTPGIAASTILPGYIRTELTARHRKPLFMVELEPGCRALVAAIEREPIAACVPAWPWLPVGALLRHVPLRLLARLS